MVQISRHKWFGSADNNHEAQQAILTDLSRQESRNLAGNNLGAEGCNEVDKQTQIP